MYSFSIEYVLIYRERVENDDGEEVDDDGGSNYCDCIHDNTIVINIFNF